MQKVPSDLTGEKKERKNAEGIDNTFDLEKREFKNTNNEILKKTNVLIHQFSNNKICTNIQLNISNIKTKSEEKKYLGNNFIDKVVDIQLLYAKMQKSPNDITEKSLISLQLYKINSLISLFFSKNEISQIFRFSIDNFSNFPKF